MGTISSMLGIAQQALLADQQALNVTSSNVANQNTAGYTRETVSFQSVDSVTLSGTTYGAGVTTSESSQRDPALDKQVQAQTQVQAQSGALESALQQVENIFGLSSSATADASTTLGTDLNSFFSSLTAFAGSPSTATRQGVITAAQTLAGDFNSASNQLTQLGDNLSQQAVSDVGQVNTLTSTIASLNQQISSLDPNQDAGTLEDQRQLAITQLSQLVGLDQISNNNNSLTLTTSNGAVLVAGNQSFAMNTEQIGGVTHIFAGVGGGQDVTSTLTGGDLGGVLQTLNQNLPSYQNALDTLAYGIGTAVNQQNAQGVDASGNVGGDLFTLPSSSTGAAAQIQMTTTDPDAVAAATSGEGSAGTTNANALAGLANTDVAGGQTATQYLSAFLSQIGNDVSQATSDNTTQQTTLTQLTTEQSSYEGVSLDEEAANLTQYQRSYQAAAQVFSIGNTIMAAALDLGVETSVT